MAFRAFPANHGAAHSFAEALAFDLCAEDEAVTVWAAGDVAGVSVRRRSVLEASPPQLEPEIVPVVAASPFFDAAPEVVSAEVLSSTG